MDGSFDQTKEEDSNIVVKTRLKTNPEIFFMQTLSDQKLIVPANDEWINTNAVRYSRKLKREAGLSSFPKVNTAIQIDAIPGLKGHLLEVALKKDRFTKVSAEVLKSDENILKEECQRALNNIFFAEIAVESATISDYDGPAKLLMPNGEIRIETLNEQVAITRVQNNKNLTFKQRISDLTLIVDEAYESEILEHASNISKSVAKEYEACQASGINPVGTNFDLVAENELKGKKLHVYNKTDGGVYYSSTTTQWLQEKGFEVTVSENPRHFLETVQKPDVIWVISGCHSSQDLQPFCQKVCDLYREGTGLFIWADNDPLFVEANLLLKELIGQGFELMGSYDGQKRLHPSKTPGIGEFDANHKIATGFVFIDEGVTICFPNKEIPELKAFAYNTSSDKKAMALYAEASKNTGAIWIDTGFTKLSEDIADSEQTRRYVTNVSAYLCKNYFHGI